MASSVVQICNLALDMLGAGPIASLDDPNKAAGLCKRNYELARDAALRAYPWNCARARVSLAASTTAPVFEFTNAFPLPVDCLRVLAVEDEVLVGISWRVEGRSLLANTSGPLRVAYVATVTDPARYDALLVNAIAAHLAALIAFAVTGKDSLSERMLAVATALERKAARIDAREQTQDDAVTADLWSGARFSSYGGV